MSGLERAPCLSFCRVAEHCSVWVLGSSYTLLEHGTRLLEVAPIAYSGPGHARVVPAVTGLLTALGTNRSRGQAPHLKNWRSGEGREE